MKSLDSVFLALFGTQLSGSSHLQIAAKNALWLFFEKAVRMGGGLLLSIIIARQLGPGLFGRLNYSIAFVAMFAALSTLGLEPIVFNELVKNRSDKPSIIGSAIGLRLAASLMLFPLTAVLIRPIQSDILIRTMVAIIAAGFVIQCLDILRTWFDSQLKSKYEVIALTAAFIITLPVKVYLVIVKADLAWFALILTIEVAMGMISIFFLFKQPGNNPGSSRFSHVIAGDLLRRSWPYMLTLFFTVVFTRISSIMIGNMLSKEDVGFFSAALAICDGFLLLPIVITYSIYPRLSQIYHENEALYTEKLVRAMSFFFRFSLTIAALIIVFSKPFTTIIYGAQYIAAYPVLSILIIFTTINSLNVMFSSRYLIKDQLRTYLYVTLIGCITSTILNFIFIPRYGPRGAAVALLISGVFPVIVISTFFDRTIGAIYLQAMFKGTHK